ncbi:hypothetical protein ACNTMW_28565 [Planosporangium sp. 12N6]|uniref:hypothetical protein n=1 Tax=Planosporangium spinosum TaxID=3402278 RepID=UPI003CEEA84F
MSTRGRHAQPNPAPLDTAAVNNAPLNNAPLNNAPLNNAPLNKAANNAPLNNAGHDDTAALDTMELGPAEPAVTAYRPGVAEPAGDAGPDAFGVDLSSDPFSEDLSTELAARAPRRATTRTTVALAGLVLVVGGFLAGAQVQKHFGTPAAAAQGRAGLPGGAGFAAAGGFGGQRANGQNGQNAGGQNAGSQNAGGAQPGGRSTGSAAAGVTTGTVKMVDGTTVYVQTPDGDVLTVRTNSSTAVQVTQGGALSDLTPGSQVSVEGAASGDGVLTATKLTRAK